MTNISELTLDMQVDFSLHREPDFTHDCKNHEYGNYKQGVINNVHKIRSVIEFETFVKLKPILNGNKMPFCQLTDSEIANIAANWKLFCVHFPNLLKTLVK